MKWKDSEIWTPERTFDEIERGYGRKSNEAARKKNQDEARSFRRLYPSFYERRDFRRLWAETFIKNGPSSAN